MTDAHNRPCAASGLTSYRYASQWGWVMIGAKGDDDALREAARSLDTTPERRLLQVWSERHGCYVPTIINRCDYLLPAWDWEGSPCCVMPDGHAEAHLSLTDEQGWVTWEKDPACDCSDCRGTDPSDACVVWERVERGEALQMAQDCFNEAGRKASHHHERTDP